MRHTFHVSNLQMLQITYPLVINFIILMPDPPYVIYVILNVWCCRYFQHFSDIDKHCQRNAIVLIVNHMSFIKTLRRGREDYYVMCILRGCLNSRSYTLTTESIHCTKFFFSFNLEKNVIGF